jgi:hypothetical protein
MGVMQTAVIRSRKLACGHFGLRKHPRLTNPTPSILDATQNVSMKRGKRKELAVGSWQLAVGWVRGDPPLRRTRCETASTVWRRWLRGYDGDGSRVGAVEDNRSTVWRRWLRGTLTIVAMAAEAVDGCAEVYG